MATLQPFDKQSLTLVEYSYHVVNYFKGLGLKEVSVRTNSLHLAELKVTVISIDRLLHTVVYQLNKRRLQSFFVNEFCINRATKSEQECIALSKAIRTEMQS